MRFHFTKFARHVCHPGLAIAVCIAAAPASAGLIGVSKIEVTSTNNTWIQVAELIATETGTGTNVALAGNGGAAFAPNIYNDGNNAGPSYAIDGIFPAFYPQIYHSGGTGPGNFLDILLANPTELDSITIYGRAGGWQDRDIYNVSFLDLAGNTIFSYTGADASQAGFAIVDLPNTAAAVPEPGILALLGLGMLGFCAARRKSEKNNKE
jgi:hypothetical protein